MARWTSNTQDSATSPIVELSAGLKKTRVAPRAAGTNFPSM
jgi:hypothetical protein